MQLLAQENQNNLEATGQFDSCLATEKKDTLCWIGFKYISAISALPLLSIILILFYVSGPSETVGSLLLHILSYYLILFSLMAAGALMALFRFKKYGILLFE